LGEQQWLHVIESYTRQQKIEEYKAAHGGRLPPDTFLVAVVKLVMPCLFQERVSVDNNIIFFVPAGHSYVFVITVGARQAGCRYGTASSWKIVFF
jgi:hypothetical protein